MIYLELPWPPRELSPNHRAHYQAKARAVKSYRRLCMAFAYNASQELPAGKLLMKIEFCPPDRRARDDDNMLASFKAGRDGIADGLKVNDNCFATLFEVGEPIKGGLVKVFISARENQ